jgi:uncharacterized glyoxalase superfamily protein PhnB
MATTYAPAGYRTVTPYLSVPDVDRLIGFLERAFGADVVERHADERGTVLHAQVLIGDSRLMIGPANPKLGPMPGALYVYVRDTDATYARALEAGAASVMEPVDQFFGDRGAGVRDVCGNVWWIATSKG